MPIKCYIPIIQRNLTPLRTTFPHMQHDPNKEHAELGNPAQECRLRVGYAVSTILCSLLPPKYRASKFISITIIDGHCLIDPDL